MNRQLLLCLTLLFATLLTLAGGAAKADITDQLKSREASTRVAGAKAVQAQEKASSETLAQLREMAIKDSEPSVRAAACEALGAHPGEPEKTIPVLIRACADGTEFDRRPVYSFAGPALAKFEGQSIPYIRKMLASDDSLEIMKAGLALDHVGPYASSLVDELVTILERQRRREIVPAVNAVRRIGPPARKAVPALGKLLDHESFHVQYWTCRAISGIGPDAAPLTDKLIELLKNGNGSVRRNAAESLGKIGAVAGESAVKALIAALDDDIYLVQANAALALSEMMPASKSAKAALLAKLDGGNFNARAQVAQALWRVDPGSQKAIDVLLAQLNDEQAPYDAVDVIANVGAEMKITSRVAAALDSESAVVREAAALSLARLGKLAKPHLATLRKMAKNDADEESRAVALGAIADIQNAK